MKFDLTKDDVAALAAVVAALKKLTCSRPILCESLGLGGFVGKHVLPAEALVRRLQRQLESPVPKRAKRKAK